MLADALGRPLRFILTPGQAGDVTKAADLLEGQSAQHVIADTAYDSRALRDVIENMGAEPVIPANPTRKHPARYDAAKYKLRNRIERCFNKLKHFRRFATRFDRRDAHFLAFAQLAAAMIWMR
jgi:transposase